ncbi:MAG: polysaccharide deacetylase family protein [Leptothrix sp. (in: b-proteobacteria)]
MSAEKVSLAAYPGNRHGAVSYTFDDGAQNSDIIITMFNEQNLKASFYVIADKISTAQWEMWLTASQKGHEIGSHSSTHILLDNPALTDSEIHHEVVDSQQSIATHIGIKPESFAFPGNKYNDKTLAEVKKYYISARFPMELNGPNYNVYYLTSTTTALDINHVLDKTAQIGNWVVFAGHSIDGAGYSPIPSSELTESLKYTAALSSTLWIDTFVNIAKYRICRNTAQIQITPTSAMEGTLTIDTKYPDMCTFPMTITINDTNVGASGRLHIQSSSTATSSQDVRLLDVSPLRPQKIYFQ